MKTNYRFGEVHKLADQVQEGNEHVSFQQIFETKHGGVDVLAFKAGQKLDTHLAPAEVMVNVVEGEIEFTMNDVRKKLQEGDFLLMGADVPHSVEAMKDSKVLLIKIKA